MSVVKIMLGDLGNVVKTLGKFSIGLVLFFGAMLLAAAYPAVVVVLAVIVFLLVISAAIYGWVENARERDRGLT
jgi:hypothetical protein